MELEIIKKKDNQFLNRTEIHFKLTHENESQITREKVRDKISSTVNAPKDCVIIDSLHSEFGKNETQGYVKVYSNKESCMKNERKHILIRNKLMEPEKKEAKQRKQAPPKKEDTVPAVKAEEKKAAPPKKEDAAPSPPKPDDKKAKKKEE